MGFAERQRGWRVYGEQGGVSENTETDAGKGGWNKFKGNRLDSVGIASFSCVTEFVHTDRVREKCIFALNFQVNGVLLKKSRAVGAGSLHFSCSNSFKDVHFASARPLLDSRDTGFSGSGYFTQASTCLCRSAVSSEDSGCPVGKKICWCCDSGALARYTAEAETVWWGCHLHSALCVEGSALPGDTGFAGRSETAEVRGGQPAQFRN